MRLFAILLVSTLVIAGLFSVLSFAGDPPAMDPRDEIMITSNTEFTSGNGVRSGSGTLTDPYVISDWEIRTNDGYGILIMNTDVYFIIRNVRSYNDPLASSQTGITLYQVENGWIDESYVNETFVGIEIHTCSNIRVTDVDIYDCETHGVIVTDSSQIRILSSNIEAAPGIEANGFPSTDIVVASNTILNTDSGTDGIAISDYSEIVVQNSTISNCTNAIFLSGDDDFEVKGNFISNSAKGIVLDAVTIGNVSGNVIDQCDSIGIHESGSSSSFEVFSNVVKSCGEGGMLFESGSDIVVLNNTLRSNHAETNLGGGVTLGASSSGMSVYSNRFTDNTPFQAYDDSTLDDNVWSGSYGVNGNHWDNHTNPDAKSGPDQDDDGSDGIVDTPYSFDPNPVDDTYPLVNEAVVNLPPVAVFTASSGPYETGDSINLDASESSDPSTPGSGIVMYRWDWEGDGTWDKDWSTSDTASHMYWYPGNFTIWLEVMDTAGLCNLTEMEITVTGEVIPEFSEIIIPVTITMAVFFIASRRRRSG